jgi:hypothetical protein
LFAGFQEPEANHSSQRDSNIGIPAGVFDRVHRFVSQSATGNAEMWTRLRLAGVIWPLAERGTPVAIKFFMIMVLIITAGLFAAAFFVEVVSAATAPFGYQDESGFHFGREYPTSAEASEIGNPS